MATQAVVGGALTRRKLCPIHIHCRFPRGMQACAALELSLCRKAVLSQDHILGEQTLELHLVDTSRPSANSPVIVPKISRPHSHSRSHKIHRAPGKCDAKFGAPCRRGQASAQTRSASCRRTCMFEIYPCSHNSSRVVALYSTRGASSVLCCDALCQPRRGVDR